MKHAYLGTRYRQVPRHLTKLKARQMALGRFKYDGRYRSDIKIPESRIQYFLIGFVALVFVSISCWLSVVVTALSGICFSDK